VGNSGMGQVERRDEEWIKIYQSISYECMKIG
jgi:hypothetical protein